MAEVAVTIRMDEKLKKSAQRMAKSQDISLSQLIRKALRTQTVGRK